MFANMFILFVCSSYANFESYYISVRRMHMERYHLTKRLSLKSKVYVLAKMMFILTIQLRKFN